MIFMRVLGAACGGLLLLVLLLSAAAVAVVGSLTSPLDSLTTPAIAAGLPDAVGEIPANMYSLYRRAAATCPGLPWTVLASIGKAMSDHGRRPAVQGIGSMGLTSLQFAENVDPTPIGDQGPSAADPKSAVGAAGRLLCRSGNRSDARTLAAEIAAAPDLAVRITELDDAYRNSPRTGTFLASAGRSAPSAAARIALDYAGAQLGLPYVWGGNGPDRGGDGFDCSGLTQSAFQTAGVAIPRTATEQFTVGVAITFVDLRAGDLVFYGDPHGFLHHVAIYAGRGYVIDAPYPGASVRLDSVAASDYAGARRLG